MYSVQMALVYLVFVSLGLVFLVAVLHFDVQSAIAAVMVAMADVRLLCAERRLDARQPT
jgi:hypothetical protein